MFTPALTPDDWAQLIAYRGGLTPASYPAPGEVWRVTVRRTGGASRIGLEILTLGIYDTSVQPVADDWEQRIHTANLGVIFAPPVVSEDAGVFVVSMRFDRSMTLAPASAIVAKWMDLIANTEVITVERVRTDQASGAGGEQGTAAEIAAQELAKAKADAEPNVFERFGGGLKSLGIGLTILAVAAAVIALVFLATKARRAATS